MSLALHPTRIMRREIQRVGLTPDYLAVGVREWRQIFIAITCKHLQPSFQMVQKFTDPEEMEEDDPEEARTGNRLGF
jgi:hypothetical protein